MAEEEVKSNHDCTRWELYTIAGMMIASGLLPAVLSKLHAYKAKYIVGLFTAYTLNLNTARNLPGEEEIKFIHVSARIDLVNFKNVCCMNFQLLKGNIKDAFPANKLEAMYALAGGDVYTNAAHENWESVAKMNSLMMKFVADPSRLSALMAAGNMNAMFPAKIASDSGNFDAEHSILTTARQTGTATSAKLTADNLCYTNLTDLCADAQLALAGLPDLQKLFVFTTVKDIVSPAGAASFKMGAKMVAAFTNVEGLKVTIQKAGEVALSKITGADGIVLFENLDSGKYVVSVEKTGLIPMTFKKEVDMGTKARTEILMEAVPPPPAPLTPPAV